MFCFISVEEFFERAAEFLATERALMMERFQQAYRPTYHRTPSPQPGPSGLHRAISPSVLVGAGVEDGSNASTIEFSYENLLMEEYRLQQQGQQAEVMLSVNTTPSDLDIIYIADSDDDSDGDNDSDDGEDDNASQQYEKCGIC